ncbi:MAG: SelT/SelW/SelH family protein [Acidobacteria bacterium]|nr:SelT/SelW/SelH family protein [Acidobacteriota bacterium]
MTQKLLEEFKHQISTLQLQPSTGGRFEVFVNGRQIYSKHATKRFPEYAEIRDALKSSTD